MAQDGSITPPRWRTQYRLVAAQVAGSVALLLLAVATSQRVTEAALAPGVDVDRIALAYVSFFFNPREGAQAEQLHTEILQRVRQAPGVESVAASDGLPFGIYPGQGRVALSDADLAADSAVNAYPVSGTADLLPTLGIPLVTGRGFTGDEVRDERPVIVLSESTAYKLFGSTDVAGRLLWFERRSEPGVSEAMTVVGVSRDTDTFNMGSRTSGAVFLPLRRAALDHLVFVARATGDPGRSGG
jgi:hypothetical protein